MEQVRCSWCVKSDIERNYHDFEWGVSLHDDRKLFEFMVLDAFQAGLNWKTILVKRENFREAFDNFEAEKIIAYDEDKINELMNNTGIIRNKLKINATVTNAKAFLEIQKEFGSFDKYIWQFTAHKTLHNAREMNQNIASSKESDEMSKSLKAKGFKFVGTTICYAFMQAAGMVNDHAANCYRFEELRK